MPTIAEIIAAKKAGATPPKPVKPATAELMPASIAGGKPESLSEKIELKAAIDRIDAPGKYQARKAGIVLRAAADPVPPPAPPSLPERRNLSQTSGEMIDLTPLSADAETKTWHAALSAFETDLVIMPDPAEPEVGWLALRPLRPGLAPILLHRVPWLLMTHPATPLPEGHPF